MTPTQKEELQGKVVFAAFFVIGMLVIWFFISKAWNNEAEKIKNEKQRIEQSVKIHDYDDQKY